MFRDFIDRHLPPPAPPAALQSDRGPLSWALHHRLMASLSTVRKAPAWALDPALAGGWLARPPRLPSLTGDGRLLALGMLVDAIPTAARRADPAVRLAVTVLVEFFAGPRAPIPVDRRLECPELHWRPRDQWSWLEAFRDSNEPAALAEGKQVAGVVAAVMNLARMVPPTWTPPPPTDEQQRQAAIRADNARRRALAERMAAAGT